MDHLALLPPHTVERNAHVGEYTTNLIASEAEDVLPLTPEYGDPLKRWWTERYTLYTGNLTAEGAKKAKKRLVLARNALRRACVEKEVIANNERQLKERIEQGMKDFGSGIATLMKLLQDSSPEEFLRTRYICECPSCNKQQHSLQVSSWSILSDTEALRHVNSDPFAALALKASQTMASPPGSKCMFCGADLHEKQTVVVGAPLQLPRFIALELLEENS